MISVIVIIIIIIFLFFVKEYSEGFDKRNCPIRIYWHIVLSIYFRVYNLMMAT